MKFHRCKIYNKKHISGISNHIQTFSPQSFQFNKNVCIPVWFSLNFDFFDQIFRPISFFFIWLFFFFIEDIEPSFPSRNISRHCNSASQGRTTQSLWIKLYLKHKLPWFHKYSCGDYILWRFAKYPRTVSNTYSSSLPGLLCLNLPSIVWTFVSTHFKYKLPMSWLQLICFAFEGQHWFSRATRSGLSNPGVVYLIHIKMQ